MGNLVSLIGLTQSVFLIENSDYIKGRVLDAGCGNQPWKRYFLKRAVPLPIDEWVGLDIRPVGDIEAPLEEIPEPDNSFDSILCADVLGFVDDPFKAASELHRVLKPGGYALLTLPYNLPERHGNWRFTEAGGKKLLERAGFECFAVKRMGGLIAAEVENLRMIGRHILPLPKEFDAFVKHAEDDYPMMFGWIVSKRGQDVQS